jgi:hypothetical protein
MLPYAAYLRVYEPLSAFSEADRERWAAYATSPDRPRRARALEAEQAEALGRLIALPPIGAPARESEHAYVRWADGVTYICPWQTRLRSWLALTRLRATSASLLAAAFAPEEVRRASRDFARWQGRASSLRVFVQACTWSVPVVWFAPFAPEERWLVLGSTAEPEARGPATASATRTLIYATAMPQARRRVAQALAAVRRAQSTGLAGHPGSPAGPGPAGPGPAGPGPAQADTELAEIGRWLEEFHPHSLVELDYGGLVHLLNDAALRADQSVAEVSAALRALGDGELELAAALYQRLRSRWQALEALELAN